MRIPLTGQTDRDDVIIIQSPQPHSPTARWAHGWAGLVPVPAARRLLRQDTDDRVGGGSQSGGRCVHADGKWRVQRNIIESNPLRVRPPPPPMSISESLGVATRMALPPGQAA